MANSRAQIRALLMLVIVLPMFTACGGVGSSDVARDGAQAQGDDPGISGAVTESVGKASSLGEGVVIWESNRSGAWRIWSRHLDGSGLRQLTSDEPGRDHFCPHISPDGRRVAYLSVAKGKPNYEPEGVEGSLHLIAVDGGEDRVVVESARSYFVHRAVVWRDPGTLIFISGDTTTRELDIESGRQRVLVEKPPPKGGWLLNSTLTHATSGVPTFSAYDRARQKVAPRSELGGCEPYFSHDGRWGFWVAGAGGPINRIDLASRAVSTILDQNDLRMEKGWGYAYFPMVSADGRLFTYAASTGRQQHDQHRSDYEVFVAETDPQTLELVGRAVRFTRHPATDRFPDVFLAPLPLGRLRGEAPFTVRLEPEEDDAAWQWSFGDSTTAEAPIGEHTYLEPGRYPVVASRDDAELRGAVVVEEAAPPRPVEVTLLENGLAVAVVFDEQIGIDGAQLAFESGRKIVAVRVASDGRSLVIDLVERFQGLDRLTLSGIGDRAQRVNLLPATVLEVEPPLWPSRRDGLVFVWESGDAANLVFDPVIDSDRAFNLQATGLARLNGHFAMELGSGSYLLDPQETLHLLRAIKRSNQWALQAVVRPAAASPAGGPTSIVAWAGGKRGYNFRLVQRGRVLVLELRTAHKGSKRELELFEIPVDRPSHVVVTYTPGRLVAYLDGEKRVDSSDLVGDFFHWREGPVVFGADGKGGGDWTGLLEGVAIYDRVLGPQEVEEDHLRYRAKLDRRVAIPRRVVEARLRARSKIPTLAEISPYREALVVFEYEVEASLSGELPLGKIRVAHWAILDGKTLPITRAAEGELLRLAVEPFDANPQLESLFLADTLTDTGGLPLFYAVDPSAGR
ncbi:MAG: LamG-like jellyroll fold domain-containing protein [Thermoanaerobaculia bacterium]